MQKILRNRKQETRSANQQYLGAAPVDQQSGNQPIFHPEQVSATAKHVARYLAVLLSHSWTYQRHQSRSPHLFLLHRRPSS